MGSWLDSYREGAILWLDSFMNLTTINVAIAVITEIKQGDDSALYALIRDLECLRQSVQP